MTLSTKYKINYRALYLSLGTSQCIPLYRNQKEFALDLLCNTEWCKNDVALDQQRLTPLRFEDQ